MQVLLGATHTVFKVDGYVNDYQQIRDYIEENFTVKQVKENILFIPSSTDTKDKRKFLMKWLYSYYKKSTLNFKKHLKFELLKRLEKPIHIHFLASKNQTVGISATFYENSICQLVLESRSETCNLYLLQYFSGNIRLQSTIFNLYELKVITQNHKRLLQNFLIQRKLDDVPVQMQYNKIALELFLKIKESPTSVKVTTELTKALALLKVKESDSLSIIKKTYKTLAKTYHPDLSKLEHEESTKKFQLISDAFSLIKKHKAAA
ncbi:J domain-containing protein [Sulfurimonas sp. SAG-AH-194-C21]|nr:J domain-containing protein [Sulfurimonas sp. SAG-AH-194-C21]MDF1884063.1 J domain-containing protein [Sulfurimonas sp. SAG-AH-194-C21]